MVTGGFFVTHSAANSWVGLLSRPNKGHAASLCLLFYYAGLSLTGPVAEWFWEHGGWPARVVLAAALSGLALMLAATMKGKTARD